MFVQNPRRCLNIALCAVPGPAAGSPIVSPASVQSSPNCFLLVISVTSTFADTSSIITVETQPCYSANLLTDSDNVDISYDDPTAHGCEV